MSLRPIDPTKALLFAKGVCSKNAAEINAAAGTSEEARLVAKQMLADLSLQYTAEPIGVALMKGDIAVPAAPASSSKGDILEGTAMSPHSAVGAPDGGRSPRRDTREVDGNDTQDQLRVRGPASALVSCPYCDEPYRRFCPESGRRHETQDERASRLWRTMFRQIQFSAKMVSAARLEKPNTCAEEFYIEF